MAFSGFTLSHFLTLCVVIQWIKVWIQVTSIKFLLRLSLCRSIAVKKKLTVRWLVVWPHSYDAIPILISFGCVSDWTYWVKTSKHSWGFSWDGCRSWHGSQGGAGGNYTMEIRASRHALLPLAWPRYTLRRLSRAIILFGLIYLCTSFLYY